MTSTIPQFRYWKVHFTNDPFDHWVRVDCGQLVTEPRAVTMAQRAMSSRGSVTNATPDFDRQPTACQHCDSRPATHAIGATEATPAHLRCWTCLASASEFASIRQLDSQVSR